MEKIVLVSRVLLGLIFLVMGANGFLNFLHAPMPEGANLFIMALKSSKLFYIVKGIEVACSVMLLTGLFLPLATVALVPIVFNIVWFHLNLAPQGLPVAIAVAALETVLIWHQRKKLGFLFKVS
jgi:putative oxidoreductase